MTIRKPELLAPAGNMEKLRIALHYGADAVYLGGKNYGLRNLADNFTPEEMVEAVCYAHDQGAKAYLTINIYPNNSDIPSLSFYLEEIGQIPFDAFIAADPGVVSMISEILPERPIHLSTQANTTNWKSALFWKQQGVTRINLAREMPLEGILEVKNRVAVELETFIHGAMCISYSGRCLLSSIMSGREANRGECSHPCRWSYSLVEETRPGEYFPVMEDETGTFIFNSKDLCLLQYIPELVNGGIDSLKIEGRMKGINYVASVVRVYREAIDRYCEDPSNYQCREEWFEELSKISHRGYTTGFLLGLPREVAQEYSSSYIRSHELVGIIEDITQDGTAVIGVRNQVRVGDFLELIGPGMKNTNFPLTEIRDTDEVPISVANPNSRIKCRIPVPAAPFDLLRRVNKSPLIQSYPGS